MPELAPGSTLGQYRIEAVLGRGGMGAVYRAVQPSLNRQVAIKVLAAGIAEEPGFVDRFRREAVTAANLKHPNIVTVHDFGENDGLLYLVMEYVSGGTLKERAEGPMPADRAVGLISQVAGALEYAHARGVIHRDIKPANIMLETPDFAKLGDFGIARLIDDTEHLTKTGVGIGTPEYMSPEQGEGMRELDNRTDIYSLGIVLYELLTGEAPFRSPSAFDIIRQHIEKPLPIDPLVEHGVPEPLIDILRTATAKSPHDRYATAGELKSALDSLGAPATVAATVAPVIVQPIGGKPLKTEQGRNIVPIVAAAALLFFLAIGGAFLAFRVLPRLNGNDGPNRPNAVQNGNIRPGGGTTPNAPVRKTYTAVPARGIDLAKTYLATIETTKGKIVFQINPQDAPVTANNFITLSRDGFYDGLTFHRVEDWVVQGGDPGGTGTGGPGYRFNDEPVKGDYTAGAVAMANAGPNTNGSQFFIIKRDTPLPKQYNLFGRIVEGQDVVNRLQRGDKMDKITITEK